jgi:hypothetical protein
VSINKYKGRVAIICGSAPCVKQEFEIVSKARPDAVIVGINEAVQIVKCDILMTYHLLEVGKFLGKSLGNPIIHTSKGFRPELKDLADGFWQVKGGATSAGDAIQICQQMGFKEIILVGCPMSGGDEYFYGKGKENVEGCPRFGNTGNEHLVNRHKARLKEIVEEGDYTNVSSMSGFTSELFGKPKLK